MVYAHEEKHALLLITRKKLNTILCFIRLNPANKEVYARIKPNAHITIMRVNKETLNNTLSMFKGAYQRYQEVNQTKIFFKKNQVTKN